MSKISIIGAGNVGATAAMNIARMGICDVVVLLDIKEGVAEGKAMDISQALSVFNVNTHVIGVTNDYKETQNSDIVIITSGVPRKPGMTREELVDVNKGVVESVMENVSKYVYTDTKYIMVSNPLDTMAMVAYNYLKNHNIADPEKKVIGMGNLLDSNRFRYNIAINLENYLEHPVAVSDVQGYVIGGHGDETMITMYTEATYAGMKINQILPIIVLNIIDANTMKGGAKLTKLLGTSAWEAPAAAIAQTAKAILQNENVIMPCSVYNKEYDLCIGRLIRLGWDGVKEIYPVPETYKKLMDQSVEAVREVNKSL